MINKILVKNIRSMETLKTTDQTITFCKLGKCIMYHNVGPNYRSGKRFVRPCRFVRP